MSAIGILLAGGASRRFPAGKLEAKIPAALAELRGRPELAGLALADAAHETLAAAVGRVIVLGEPTLASSAECVPDARPGEGPAASLSDLLTGDRLASLADETRLAADAPFVAGSGLTRIFVKPGHVVTGFDALVTNFHLPESTLLVLVGALIGRRRVLDAYAEAVREGYRFFSYGDAMFIQ